jgi:serine/threonine-protein kinase
VSNRYRIISLLGRGGMGEVYRADDLTLGASVALKFLPADLPGDAVRTQGLYDEVRLARQVTHPHVCRVHDIGVTEGGRPFLVMEYVDGEDLARLLQRIGRLPKEKALEIGRELCGGLAAVHGQGLVHRDLKPANVMLDSRGRVRLTDFGIAVTRDRSERLAGTPAYMAPELFRGAPASTASDIFALGLVLCEILTGRRPSAPHLQDPARVGPDGTPPMVDSPFGDLDEHVRAILSLCLAVHPSARPSAAWVAAALGGDDALQAAMSAGHTPSPQAIALGGRSGVLDIRVASACFAAVVVLLSVFYMLNDRVVLTSYRPLPSSAAALQFKAREHLRALGIQADERYWASGFEADRTVLDAATALSPAAQTAFLANPRTSPVFFWYRTRPEPLVPLSAIRVTRTDPAPTFDDVLITLNPDGSLISLARHPPQAVRTSVDAPRSPEWNRLFAFAGLDVAAFQVAAPRITTAAAAGDTRVAWLEQAGGPLGPRRVEASALRNDIVSFSTVYDKVFPESGGIAVAPGETIRSWARRAIALLWDALFVVGALVAWRQVRTGRADVRGAARLGFALLLLAVVSELLMRERLLATLGTDPILRRLPTALWRTAQVVVFYLAAEPFIRRYAPHRFISWSRLLSGRFTDPLVGRDLLIGVLAGVVTLLIAFASFSMEIRNVGPAVGALWAPEQAVDVANGVGYLLAVIRSSIALTLLSTLCYAAGFILTRRVWAAAALNLVIGMAFVLESYFHWTGAVVGALTLPVFMAVLLRVGTLAMTATFSTFFMVNFAVASDPTHWRFAATLVPGLLLLGIACYGFGTSTGMVRSARR